MNLATDPAGSVPGRVVATRAAAVGVLAFAVYLGLGLVRFATGHTGNYDLGIFTQAAQRWSSGAWPGSTIRSVDNLFADHFSPITAGFGLGWWLWPDPRSLIVVQALVMATAVAVVTAVAVRHLPGPLALALAAMVAVSKGLISAASFDVHEVAFGTVGVAALGWALLERRPRLAVVASVGLLLVKEDLGLTVIAAGAVWWWLHRDRRIGLVLVGVGLAGFALANAVIIAVAPDHRNPYLQFLTGASGNPQGLAGAEVLDGWRFAPLLLFVAATGVIGLRSPIAAVAAPTLLWRAVSSNQSYWQTYFHYDAVLVPIAAIALIDVLRRGREPLRFWAVVAAGSLLYAGGLGVAKIATWSPWTPSRYTATATMADSARLARQIPAGSPVVAQQDLGPAVLDRVDVRMLSTLPGARARWVLLTESGSPLGAPESAKRAWLAAQSARPGVTVTRAGSVVLVQLPTEEEVRLGG